jgi:hypothetical protein
LYSFILLPYPFLLFTQESTLFFQPSQQPPKLPDHLAITRPIDLALPDDKRKVEYELIPAVLCTLYAYRISNNAMVIDNEREQAVAKVLTRYEVARYGGEREQSFGEVGLGRNR